MTQPVINQMQTLIDGWNQIGDRRAIFLTCYAMMTQNMLNAVEKWEFHDGEWVKKLLHRFADYYFEALEAYEQAQSTPEVWKYAFDAAHATDTPIHVIQHLILGVNAHICYDLVFALQDLLRKEWATLTPQQREQRYQDHLQVNEIIYQTIDRVQDQIIAQYSPIMGQIDTVFARADEWIIRRLITHWRDQVWDTALQCMECSTQTELTTLRQQIEADALKRAQAILGERGLIGVLDVI
ncbi:MAG: DUF5995 family protein [Anaerolineae bacterium]|nr:DUF5995 family protein [Anaerolineae bacterium]